MLPVMDAYVAAIEDGFQEFGIANDSILIGNGFGGTVALAFALWRDRALRSRTGCRLRPCRRRRPAVRRPPSSRRNPSRYSYARRDRDEMPAAWPRHPVCRGRELKTACFSPASI
jgi:pimeloyl-ACP methyl ester carboxylesterase